MSRLPHILTLAALATMLPATAIYGDEAPARPDILQAGVSDFVAERTTAANRAQFLETRYSEIINKHLVGELAEEDGREWRGAFWTAGIINERGPVVRNALSRAFEGFAEYGEANQRAIMHTAYGIFPGVYTEEVRAALPDAVHPRPFAIGAHYLLAAGADEETRDLIRSLMARMFPDWENDGRLIWLGHRLEISAAEEVALRPPLVDLLAADTFGQRPVVFSFQRVDRTQPGLAMVRRADGTFARRSDGSFFNVQHLAMARTNMPGTITFGNSPQGIYTVRGTGTAQNEFIGPTPYLWSKVPFEASTTEFLHGEARPDWESPIYKEILPVEWRDYFPIWEAWYAGMAGRSEMIMHGTTINPDFYRGTSYYPLTPSAGCLCTVEFWSPEDGTLVHSDQLGLVQTFLGSG
ncbi:MAG: hypothetical protein JJU11_13010, partial [Candidatus Sumerlaeia bacterium]|nr:hypothetical protein [Candidatus Sumerlaeia bacterium]